MEKITNAQMNFKVFEKTIYDTTCQIACELVSEYLQACDREVLAMRDTKEYRFVNFGTTTIKTLMGEVSYTRRRYKKREGGYVYLLDEALGINGDCGLISENLAEQIVLECTDKSFRKAASSISSLTGQRISAMGAWGVVSRYGERLEKQEARLGELAANGITGQLGNIESKALFSELDDVWITMQREKRRKPGSPAPAGRRRIGKRPMHIGTAYTGWKKAEGSRYKTVDKIAYASFDETPVFLSKYGTLLLHRFDMDGVERQVMNGDGAGWIKTAAEESGAILQLDPYHRSRAIVKAVDDKNDRDALYGAFKEKDVEKALDIVSDLLTRATEKSACKKLEDLLEYFDNNKESLLTWQERGIELPTPPEGLVYKSLGVQESSNCNLLTQRMKHRKGSWSKSGANSMAKILCYRYTIGIDSMLGTLPEPPEDQWTPLSAAKAPIYDGKGYDGGWLHAEMPFEQVFRTNGREVIRGLLRQRGLSELRII